MMELNSPRWNKQTNFKYNIQNKKGIHKCKKWNVVHTIYNLKGYMKWIKMNTVIFGSVQYITVVFSITIKRF